MEWSKKTEGTDSALLENLLWGMGGLFQYLVAAALPPLSHMWANLIQQTYLTPSDGIQTTGYRIDIACYRKMHMTSPCKNIYLRNELVKSKSCIRNSHSLSHEGQGYIAVQKSANIIIIIRIMTSDAYIQKI